MSFHELLTDPSMTPLSGSLPVLLQIKGNSESSTEPSQWHHLQVYQKCKSEIKVIK
jgi:hypothetical protein